MAQDCWWWMQSDANLSQHPNSLLAGNLAGNFLKKGHVKAILASETRAASNAYNQIPCSTEQGIFCAEQGILSTEQGILIVVPAALPDPDLWVSSNGAVSGHLTATDGRRIIEGKRRSIEQRSAITGHISTPQFLFKEMPVD